MDYKLSLYGKKPMGSTWDKIVKTRSRIIWYFRYIVKQRKESTFDHKDKRI